MLTAIVTPVLGIPAQPHFFDNLVDHFSADDSTFSQRYYQNETWWAGPGHPILLIMGGEGAIPPETGIFYPFVVDDLAKDLGALVIEPEHRYYGESIISGRGMSLLTPQQALADAARLVEATRRARNCSTERGSEGYCPAVAIGGSYPGFLAAAMRLRYPSVIDIGYSASAPMRFYAQRVDQFAYYKRVTESAEKAVPGCPAAVRRILGSTLAGTSKNAMINGLGLCSPLPQYLEEGSAEILSQELAMVVSYTFAGLNMGNYPPPDTRLKAACEAIVAAAQGPPSGYFETLRAFLSGYSTQNAVSIAHHPDVEGKCYNLSAQLPAGPNATVSSGDWSGVGTGQNGENWDFQTCTYLVEQIGTNNVTDMFLPRNWTFDWLDQHCASRFGRAPRPRDLADLWGFDELTRVGATRIIFTNGLMDGWSVGGYVQDLSDTIIAVNMPNGAHHSDLSHMPAGPSDTADVVEAREKVKSTIKTWLTSL